MEFLIALLMMWLFFWLLWRFIGGTINLLTGRRRRDRNRAVIFHSTHCQCEYHRGYDRHIRRHPRRF